jgi:hypothetical protein
MTTADLRSRGGREPTGFTRELPRSVPVRDEVADALDHLAAVTGVSKTHIVRVAVEHYIAGLGLVLEQPVDVTTYRRRPQ